MVGCIESFQLSSDRLQFRSAVKASHAQIVRTMTMIQKDKDEEIFKIWRATKEFLPAVLTGAWSQDRGDENPGAALYNMFIVRLPTIICGIWYLKGLVTSPGSGGFSLDFGFGTDVVEGGPIVVVVVLYLILR